jgi:outer membrane protein assembly factor BamB
MPGSQLTPVAADGVPPPLNRRDRQSGQRRWSYDIKKDGNQNSFHGNPLITDDLILIGTDGAMGHVYAFERATGKVVWKHAITRSVSGNGGATTDVLGSGANAYVVTIGDELTRGRRSAR